MHPRRKLSALALATLFVQPAASVFAADADSDAVVVTAHRLSQRDSETTFATEIHGRQQIADSGASTLYDYFAQHTSVLVMPSYGNTSAPKIDMRGFGIGDGYQNVVITVDGVRMNNIDMVTPLIGAIPLADIERIEITKGSGSVLYGDGATAGTIQIYTRKPKTGGEVSVSAGNYGFLSASGRAALVQDKFTLAASANRTQTGGYSEADSTGHRDAATNDTWQTDLTVSPLDTLKLRLNAGASQIDTRYAGSLTQSDFDANPAQNNGSVYTYQHLETAHWKAGGDLWLTSALKLTLDHTREDRSSEFFAPWSSRFNYDISANDLALQYCEGDSALTVGWQNFNGDRIDVSAFTANVTSKDNRAWFAQGQQKFGALTLSLGGRSERVEYTYAPAAGAASSAHHDLHAWDLGANYRVSDGLSLFGNLNSAYQAPDIDRFFNWGGTFNSFISPARVRTLNFGLTHATAANRLKVTAFRSTLRNEIYYYDTGNWLTSFNTNIDESHKYGLEVQDQWRLTPALQATVNYAYTRAIVDSEDQGAGAYNGKDMPGVSRHSINLGASYRLTERTQLSASHVWRSATWAADDFDNNNAQKQRAFSSTNLAVRHFVKQDLELFASVDNLFERRNGLWVGDDEVYPVNFTRTWKFGARASF